VLSGIRRCPDAMRSCFSMFLGALTPQADGHERTTLPSLRSLVERLGQLVHPPKHGLCISTTLLSQRSPLLQGCRIITRLSSFQAILKKRERIKQKTFEARRLQHSKIAA